MNARGMTRAGASGLLALGVLVGVGFAQQGGLGERLGQGLDDVGRGLRRGAVDVTDSMRRGFETVRGDVQRMALPQRVYSRLHWDKALVNSKIEVQVFRGNVVLLRGSVPDPATRARAVELATSTADVREVIDELVPLVKHGTSAPVPAIEPAVTPVPPASARGTARPL
jgi:hyperosmotically inducible periplasmic protein